MNSLTFVFGILLIGIPLAEALNITIDNTSPLVVFSPTPCFQVDIPDCSPEWQLSESIDAFNGSTTTTTGPNAALGLTVVPRVSLVFQGSSVVFVPGQHSTAQATVVVDNLASILVNTSVNAFTGTGLDPATNHTITVTFVPGNGLTSLDVDYFVIGLPDTNITRCATSVSQIAKTLSTPLSAPLHLHSSLPRSRPHFLLPPPRHPL
ncbi:hypothetical protein JB92DRAFT_2912609 [Gautieria morchelliformis]|nr:hypothetical protein JB92DRAFT_2912609 [Gautieria morchelliformis]